MSQPSGRILSLPAKYRTYLRCNPIICVSDTISIPFHFILYIRYFPLKDAIRLLICERFGDSGEGEEGIQAVENYTFVRWLFFVFGTLGPAIKLMAMEGVPWTRSWGAMFLASYLAVEILVVLSWIYGTHEPLLETQPTERLLVIRKRLRTLDTEFLIVSAFVYIIVLIWTTIGIYTNFGMSIFADSVETLALDPSLRLNIAAVEFLCGIIVLGVMILVLPIIWPINVAFMDFIRSVIRRNYVGLARILIRYLALACLGVLGGFAFPSIKLLMLNFFYSFPFMLAVASPGILVWVYLIDWAELWPSFSRNVFITWESDKERTGEERLESKENVWTFLCFAMFLYTTVLSLLWYCYRYNPEGTVNRGWTGVFG